MTSNSMWPLPSPPFPAVPGIHTMLQILQILYNTSGESPQIPARFGPNPLQIRAWPSSSELPSELGPVSPNNPESTMSSLLFLPSLSLTHSLTGRPTLFHTITSFSSFYTSDKSVGLVWNYTWHFLPFQHYYNLLNWHQKCSFFSLGIEKKFCLHTYKCHWYWYKDAN